MRSVILLFISSLSCLTFQGQKTAALRPVQKNTGQTTAPEKTITGTWQWLWEGSNWERTSWSQKGVLKKTMIINKDGTIFFYKNDTLVKKDHYRTNQRPYIIELETSHERFSIELDGDELYMGVPGCVCGCLTNAYVRKK